MHTSENADVCEDAVAVSPPVAPKRRGFTPLPDDPVDTDPLVTRPIHQLSLPADDLPVIPSLADHILLAGEAMERRLRAAGGRAARGPLAAEPAPGSIDSVVLHVIRGAGPLGILGPRLVEEVRARNAGSLGWSGHLIRNATHRLVAARLITDETAERNHRLFRAVGA